MERAIYGFSAAFFAVLSCCLAVADDPYRGEYARKSWNLTPEAKAFVEDCAEKGAAYRRRTGRTYLYCRSQLKYGNERKDYLHNWYERPLYQDSTFAPVPGKELVNEKSWRRQVDGMRLMKLDGFAAYLSTARRIEILDRCLLPGAECSVLGELCSIDSNKGIEHCVRLAGRLLGHPNSFRMDGKTVIAGYPGVNGDNVAASGKWWSDLRAALDKEYGPGKFLLIPYFGFVNGPDLSKPVTTKEAVESWRDNLRSILEHTDGGMYHLSGMFWGRRYNPAFHDNVVIPILKSVYAEPRFAGKRIAMAITQGHENCYRWLYGIDSVGTRTLRDALASAEKLKPDFVMFTEWDEENENTHFRPLTSNGHVSQRIVRCWADKDAGREPTVMPGDDVSVPNLVVSYRKTLMAGEPAETEVLYIPDGTAPTEGWTVSFRWKDASGRTVKEWPERALDAKEMSAAWFKCPASELVEARILYPELTVRSGGNVRTFSDGMWPLNVEANRNLDFKWQKNALREIPSGVTGAITVAKKRPDGCYEVKGSVKGAARFRNIEVLENFDTVYMHDSARPEGFAGTVKVRVSFEGLPATAGHPRLNGSVSLVGDGGARFLFEPGGTAAVRKSERKIEFRGFPLSQWRRTFIVEMPESAVAGTSVEIDFKGLVKKTVRMSEVVEKRYLVDPLPYGKLAVFERVFAPQSIPAPCNVSEAEFSFLFRPVNPLSVLRLRLIDENYRIWHATTVPQFLEPSGEKVTFHVCERTADETVRELTLDKSRLVHMDYVFNGTRGGAVYTPGYDDMPIVFGGSVSAVTGIGRGESGYGNAMSDSPRSLVKYPEAARMAPELSPEGSLVFKDCAFASIAHQAVPVFAGFELEMKVKAEPQEGKVALYDSGPIGVNLSLEGGVPAAFVCSGGKMGAGGRNRAEGDEVSGPALRIGEWNTVKLVYDQTVAYLEVNGVKGEVKKVKGWRFNPRIGGIGICVESGAPKTPDGFFRGEIASFKVTPR